MNSKYGKTFNPYWSLLSLSDEIDLKINDKYVVLSNLSNYYTWKNIKKLYKNNEFKISAPVINSN